MINFVQIILQFFISSKSFCLSDVSQFWEVPFRQNLYLKQEFSEASYHKNSLSRVSLKGSDHEFGAVQISKSSFQFIRTGISFQCFRQRSSSVITHCDLSFDWHHFKLVQFLKFLCSIERLWLPCWIFSKKFVMCECKGNNSQIRLENMKTCGVLEMANLMPSLGWKKVSSIKRGFRKSV